MAVTRALLLTDVVDSTKLSETLGDEAMAALWARHDRVARDLLREHGGREIDKTDGFLFLFDGATAAATYAAAYHRALRELGIEARAGLHVGDVILTENRPEDVALGAKPLEVDGIAKPTAARVMSVAIGGQTLLTPTALAALGDSGLRVESHGNWRMKGLAEPIELFEAGDAEAPFVPPPDGAKVYRVVEREGLWLPVREVPHHLPAERDAFVGRGEDLRTLAERVETSRLVTVLGIGGTGKTRLVTRFAWTWLGDFPGGVWMCDLSEARDVDGIVRAVAAALDVPLRGDPVEQLGRVIADRGRALFVLDNFEQVAGHAAGTLGTWLDRAPAARFVVTSREVLGLAGETMVALAPMPSEASVELFLARAKQAKRGFHCAPEERAAIEELVLLLDGLPLAIELAAARVRVMPPRTLLERMSQRFKLLASSAGGRHSRQATLRGALDWSWDLLSTDERSALAQLSVFQGGFDLEAAEGVLALDELWAMDAVQALVDKSLVRQRAEDRFDLLVSVQEYAAEKLGEAREGAEARHGAWFAQLGTDEALDGLMTHGGVERRDALGRELDNLIGACRCATDRGDLPTAVATLSAAYGWLQLRGPLALALELCRELVEQAPEGSRERVLAEQLLGRALSDSGLQGQATEVLESALDAARALGDIDLEARVLSRLGMAYCRRARPDLGEGRLERALALFRDAGNRPLEANMLASLGIVSWRLGRVDEGVDRMQRSVEMLREVGNRALEGGVLTNLAQLQFDRGRLNEVHALLEPSLAIHREVGNRAFEGIALCLLARVDQAQGRSEAAVDHFRRALEANREVGARQTEVTTLMALALCFLSEGRFGEAREQLDIALDRGRAPHQEAYTRMNLGYLFWCQGRLEQAREEYSRSLELARASSLGSLVPVLLAGLARMEAALGSEAWVALADEAVATAEGRARASVEALAVRAGLRCRFGAVEDARADVEAGHSFGSVSTSSLELFLAEARVRHAEGRHESARVALERARGLLVEAGRGPHSPGGRELSDLEDMLGCRVR